MLAPETGHRLLRKAACWWSAVPMGRLRAGLAGCLISESYACGSRTGDTAGAVAFRQPVLAL